MKNENNKIVHNISRSNAIKKLGKYALLTSLGTIIILNPKKAQATSPLLPPPPGDDFF